MHRRRSGLRAGLDEGFGGGFFSGAVSGRVSGLRKGPRRMETQGGELGAGIGVGTRGGWMRFTIYLRRWMRDGRVGVVAFRIGDGCLDMESPLSFLWSSRRLFFFL